MILSLNSTNLTINRATKSFMEKMKVKINIKTKQETMCALTKKLKNGKNMTLKMDLFSSKISKLANIRSLMNMDFVLKKINLGIFIDTIAMEIGLFWAPKDRCEGLINRVMKLKGILSLENSTGLIATDMK